VTAGRTMDSLPTPQPASSPSRRRWLIVPAVVLAAAAALGGWWAWRRAAPPEPPAPDLTGADPEVAEAVEEARRAVLHSPRSGAAWGRFGMVLRAHDFDEDSSLCFRQAERLEPMSPRWPYLHALTLLLTDPEAGIALLRRAVELCGDSPPQPRLRLAEALLAQGRDDEAEAHFRLALAHDPDSARAHLGLARLAGRRGDLAACRQHLRFCRDNPSSRKASRLLLAEVHHRLREQEAEKELRSADGLPDDALWPDPFVEEVLRLQVGVQARIEQAGQLLAQGRGGEAVALLRETVQRRPDAAPAWLALGRTFVWMENYAAAEDALREAVRRAPDSVEGRFLLGSMLFLRGKHVEAEACFRKVIEQKPDHALAHYNLGHCRLRQNDRTGAAAAFREALRCKPDYRPAQEALEKVQKP